MSIDATRATMEAYFQALADRSDYGRFFTPDVSFRMMGTDQAAEGAEVVEALIRFLHEQAFDASPVVRSLVVSPARAAAEFAFLGRHTGEFGGVPASGRQVDVPYAVVYDVEGDRIRALRVYLSLELLLAQITGATSGAATAA